MSTAGSVNGFSHVGVTVADLERSIRFYELLDFGVVARWVRTEDYLRELVGYPTVDLHAAVLRHDACDVFLELLEYRNVSRASIDPANGNPGTSHFCLFVDGFEELWERLAAAGVDSVSGPVTPTVGPNKGSLAVYLIDPDGHRVELVETPRNLDGSLRFQSSASSGSAGSAGSAGSDAGSDDEPLPAGALAAPGREDV